jgi:RND family efflux transporter MFP subunit
MKLTLWIISSIALALGATVIWIVMEHRSSHEATPVASAQDATQPTDHKQLYHCGMHPQVIQDHPGFCPICRMALTPMKEDSQASGAKVIRYWWDPMLGPSSISDKPGKSAMGMDLVPVYASDISAGPTVTIDPTIVQNMGVRTAVVVRGSTDVTMRAVGMVEVPQDSLHDFSLRVGGWVEKLYANTDGMHVKQGDVLLDLYSPDLQVASQELISASRSRSALNDSASADVKKEADDLVAESRQKLRLWGVADHDIDAIAAADHPPKTVPFRSPVTGHVVDDQIVQGSAVQAGTKLLRIEDHSHLWLDAQVYEDQLPGIALGANVEATVEGVPGKVFNGQVLFIYPHLNHMSRTDIVRTTLDNTQGEIKPGMFATVRITTHAATDVILAPREAVIDTGTRKIAFVAEPEGHFEPRTVSTGLSGDNGKIEILSGLAPGETVVTSGQFLMDVESNTTEAIDKLRQNPSEMLHLESTNKGAMP